MKNLIATFAFALLLTGCAHVPEIQTKVNSFHTFNVPTGPEDFVLDTLSSNTPRLLVSCGIKRKDDLSKGAFVYINLHTKKVSNIPTILPENIALFPHGIDLLKMNDSLFLYAVNHEPKLKGKKDFARNSVLKFLLQKDSLFFMKKYAAPCIVSPNAVCALADGNILVTNMNTGSYLSNGNVCYCNSDTCFRVSKKIFYANGITRNKEFIYVASTLKNKVFRYTFSDNKLHENVTVEKVYGGDNLRIVNDTLYVAAHLNINKFLGHAKKASKHSPSAVYEIPLATMQPKLIFYHEGDLIDASSTAIKYNGKLYITGVFDPEVIEIKLTE